MKTLKRRPDSGFVKYPKDFDKRIIEGTARYRTKCDMLVGPCACGGVHQENECWVSDMLADYDCEIEPLTLMAKNGRVRIPRYWNKSVSHSRCDTLVGRCACGRTHNGTEDWIMQMLSDHNTVIEGIPSSPNLPKTTAPPSRDRAQRNQI